MNTYIENPYNITYLIMGIIVLLVIILAAVFIIRRIVKENKTILVTEKAIILSKSESPQPVVVMQTERGEVIKMNVKQNIFVSLNVGSQGMLKHYGSFFSEFKELK